MMKYSTLQPYLEKKLISERAHPEKESIKIYNYTPTCQYSQAWDEITSQCRGLVIDWGTNKILANPFPKFFNLEEHLLSGKSLPDCFPIVYEKMDGWLGILYWLNDRPYIATRGSFESVGAKWATKWFRDNIYWASIDREYTHLFEIIAPETKIVINYNFQGLVHLATRHTTSGIEQFSTDRLPKLLTGADMQSARTITGNGQYPSLEMLKSFEKPNEEGFVLAWPTGFRLKIKFDEYKRLHKILTRISPRVIWEYLKDDQDIETLLDRVPDEFYKWVKKIINELTYNFDKIQEEVLLIIEKAKHLNSRKEQAEYIKQQKYQSIAFALLDNKEYTKIIWQLLKPKIDNTFKIDEA